ncbi:hypothetical protein G5714_014853 [Onychostoma macrolepis]|uniref:THAP domain-containing protein 1 n=1 Tax=Onychostoma macrolepis TaxID=369639 RepID=A0A7J6C9H0_9TELE|nr:hypothetical protein G5714_014853 [Onychostoma macrolepis]
MVCCVIHGCSNSSNKNPGVSFYAIPTVRKREGKETEQLSQRRRDLWLARINRVNFQPTPHSKVCSHHFTTGKPSYLHDSTHPDWAPSLKLAGEIGQTGKAERSRKGCVMGRYNRVQQRRAQASSSGSVAQEQDSPGMNTTEAYNERDQLQSHQLCRSALLMDMALRKVCPQALGEGLWKKDP